MYGCQIERYQGLSRGLCSTAWTFRRGAASHAPGAARRAAGGSVSVHPGAVGRARGVQTSARGLQFMLSGRLLRQVCGCGAMQRCSSRGGGGWDSREGGTTGYCALRGPSPTSPEDGCRRARARRSTKEVPPRWKIATAKEIAPSTCSSPSFRPGSAAAWSRGSATWPRGPRWNAVLRVADWTRTSEKATRAFDELQRASTLTR